MRESQIQVLGDTARRKRQKRLFLSIVLFVLFVVISALILSKWSYIKSHLTELPTNENGTTISPALQNMVDSLLRNGMQQPDVNAIQGQAIVMEVKTGAIKAMVGLERRFDSSIQSCENFAFQQEQGGTMMPVSILADLETGNIKMSDVEDTGSGIWPRKNKLDFENNEIDADYLYKNRDIIVSDHNWLRGGYGNITLEESLILSSNIGVSMATQEAFEGKYDSFFNKLDSMSFGQPFDVEGILGLKQPRFIVSPEDSDWSAEKYLLHSIGYERIMSPIQILTFYNAIANDGKMVKPELNPNNLEIINDNIAKKENIISIQNALQCVVAQGLGKKAGNGSIAVAGMPGTIRINSSSLYTPEYHVSFCGYFPAENPRYSIIVSMNKIGLPASGGGQAGPIFREIAEYITEKGM